MQDKFPVLSEYGYHAPVMDLFKKAFCNEGWLPERGLEWFFRGNVLCGVASSQNAYIVNDDQGNYLGMGTEEAYQYIYYPPVDSDTEYVYDTFWAYQHIRAPGRNIWLGPKGSDDSSGAFFYSEPLGEQNQV